jgi:probable phosphoglycerate mutase
MATTGAGSAYDAESVPAGIPAGVLVLVRHGETEWSAAGRHTGRTDVPLTEAGERQGRAIAETLKQVLAGRRVVLSLTSPLSRARRTAQLAGLAATEDPALSEVDYGEYEGRTTAWIRTSAPGWTVWTGGLPGGETLDAVAARADEVIERAREALAAAGTEDPPPAAVLVAHGHLLRVLAARWIGLPPCAGGLFALGTASVSVLGREHDTPALVHWNMPVDNGSP